MKKLLTRIMMGLTATVMALSVFSGCSTASGENLSGYVAVDINPSIEFITDKDGKVTEVRAVNDDAKVLLVDMDLENISISLAIEKVTKEAEACGYIDSANTDVSITISGNTEEAEKKLRELAEKGVKRGSELAKIAHDTIHDALNNQVEALKEKNPELYQELTVAKLKIINSIMEYDRSITLDELVNKNMSELVATLKVYIEQFAEFFDEELEIKFEEKLQELATDIYTQIDALIGDAAIQAKLALLRKLELVEEKIEHQLEYGNKPIFHFERDLEYDEEDEHVLTDSMKEQLMTVINDQEIVDTIITMEDLDDYIDELEEEVETAYENLSNEIKVQIEQLKVQINTLKELVKGQIKELAEGVKAELKIQKELLKLPIGA